MFPLGTDLPLRHKPWMNYLLIAANVLVYFFTHGSHGEIKHPDVDKYLLDPAHPALFQYITYQFLHQDHWHLLGNMLFLYVFGNNLNDKLGHVAYLTFYLTGGVLAGCGQVLTSTSPTLGASGSISAVTGLFFVLLPRTNIRVFFWIFFYVDILEIPSLWFILFSIGKDVVEGMLPNTNVAHWAHVSGNMAGVGIGFFILLTGLVQRDHYDLLSMISRWRRRREYEQLVNKGFDPFVPKPQNPFLFIYNIIAV